MNWVQRLVDDMADEGYVLHPGDAPGEYIVQAFRERRYEPPVLLRLDPVMLERYITEAAASAEFVFPEVDPVEGGYRLTWIHLLDETVDSDLPPMQEVWFEDDKIKYTPVEGWKHPLEGVPKGDYRWTTTRPDPDGIVREKGSRRRGGSRKRSGR